MGEEIFLPAEVVSALERGATIVTGNQRAARTLRRGFDRRNRAMGLSRWQPAKVLAWDAWVSGWWSRLVMEGKAAAMLLNRSQELSLWRGVLMADEALVSLRSVDSLAEMASETWRLVCNYGGQGRLREWGATASTEAFQEWAREFVQRCRAEGLLSRAVLEEALRRRVVAGEVEVGEREIVLVGFDALTPAQEGLVEAARAAGTVIGELKLGVPAGQRVLVEAADEAGELRACASWVRQFLEGRPGGRVGVIVPALDGLRAEIDRVFREVLAPELEDIAIDGGDTPFEFSVGVALASTPMVAAALDLLGWVRGSLPLERVSGLLLSPYFAGGGEVLGARAEFDAFVLRREKMLRPEVSLEALIAWTERSRMRDSLAALLTALRRMQVSVSRSFAKSETQTYADWTEAIQELLSAADWGAGRREDSTEFQTRAKWESALDELATLDFDGRRVRFDEALHSLERIARRTMFAPESKEAPVQVMGPLEAAGSEFDAVWFLRAGELTWPIPARTNPLLPWGMQRELHMPGVDAGRDAEFARRVTGRIAESAGTAVFSFALESSEGRQRASHSLHGLGLEKIPAGDLVARPEERATVKLETIADVRPVAALPDEVLGGEANVLELQAACGFRAFAEHRLWSTEVEDIELGMDARESGDIVHRILESFWKRVGSQAELKAMTAMERIFALDEAIESGIAHATALSGSEWDEAYVAMLRERLRRLLSPWIAKEMERPEFVVKELEQKLSDVRVGPLRLRVRVDRVDATAAGEIVIDYKTGNTETRDWLTDRPDAPQLPLYAIVATEEDLAAVAFGVVRAGTNMKWKYFAADASTLGSKPSKMDEPSFPLQIERWREVLTELATQFAAGDARVAPKWFPKTCERCAQRMLCRVDPVTVDEMDDEELEVGFD